MSAGEVRYEVSDRIGVVTLSRPGKRNSLTLEMIETLGTVVKGLRSGDRPRVLVIRGEGDEGLAAGVNLNVMAGMNPEEARDFSLGVQDILTQLETLPIPVLAAISGYALGGGLELALACDMIFTSENARLGFPEVNLGIIPGWGGCIRAPARIGPGRARDLIFSGRIIGAKEALQIGLVEAVFPQDTFYADVMEYALMLAGKSANSLALAKSAVLRGMESSLEAGLAMEREAFALCFAHPDAREGITAFLEKRKPVFEK
jgi:enoyl-CoA hydratase